MSKRLISLLLAILCVCALVLPASAVESDASVPTEETTAADSATEQEPSAPADEAEDAKEEPAAEATEEPAAEATEEPDPSETEQPAAETTPEPTSTPEPTPTPKPGPWYQAAMDYAVEEGLLYGDSKGNLMPTGKANRAQVAAILSRVFGLTKGKGLTQFPDVDKNAWYYDSLGIAAEMRIILGDADIHMRPNDTITRQEAFVIIARTFSIPTGKTATLDQFKDGDAVAKWARAQLAGMVESGFLNGSNNKKLNPEDEITRAEIAQVLYNMGIVFFDDPADLPADGFAVYTGSKALNLTDFSGQLYLAGKSKSLTLKGDAPEVKVFVRKDPGAKITLNGTVDEVVLCSRNTKLTGSGSAKVVECAAVGCTNAIETAQENVTYDAGLIGVTAQVNEPAPLTPENRSTKITVKYTGADLTNAKNGARSCVVHWWLDGVRQADQTATLNPDATVSFTVKEPLWQRKMPTGHTVKVQLLYGTDVVSSKVTAAVQNYSDEEYRAIAKNNAYPYRIEVVKNQCTVLVYGLDKSGNYSILHKVFVCSPGNPTPIGTFHTGTKQRWGLLMGGVWGQYCTQIYQGILFHSVYYRSSDPSTLYSSAYNQLGTICSHGCVRVTVEAAKWMYENCPSNTTVQIYNSNSLPVAKPTAQRIPTSGVYSGWDPTDPDSRNPWNK